MSVIAQVQEAWRHAAVELGFDFVAPYFIEDGGRKIEFHGFVSGFGSAKGTLFIANEHFDVGIGPAPRVAKDEGYFFSRINAEVYRRFDRDVFIEALKDWGYYRKDRSAPEWITTER